MTDTTPAMHVPLTRFSVADDCLQIGGISLVRLVEQVGRTPFYAYDREQIRARIDELRRALPSELRLHYAVKANPMSALVQFIAPLVDGVDVASASEMQLALNAGVCAGDVSLAGPGKTPAELARAVAAGIVINVESETEMARLAAIARQFTSRPKIAVRVNPDFEMRSSGMKMAGGPKPFGIDAERVPALLNQLTNLPLEFIGFHIFSGSQNLNAETIVEAQSRTLELAFLLSEDAPAPVRMLNIGGGFGIPYFAGDKPLDLARVGAHLADWLPEIHLRLPQAQLILELGRFLVGEAGIYVCRVIDRKVSRGQVFLITDGGLHHHLAASGNLGQVIRKNYPVIVGNRVHGKERESVSVVGPLCTPLDILADKIELPKANIGDLIVVQQSGAYGLTASPTAFLGHPAPAEILL